MTPRFDDAPGVIVIADDAAATALATRAVAHASARLLATVSWDEAPGRVAAQIAPATLLIEAGGLAEDTLEATLPGLVELAGAARTIVAFDWARADQIGGMLVGSDATLLCDPIPADRIVALVMAAHPDVPAVHDSRDEAVRLARINAEVARFTETLARLTGVGGQAAAAAMRAPIAGEPQQSSAPTVEAGPVTAGELRRAIRSRRLRDEVVGVPGLFEDPAWDMLLDLFAAELERRRVSVSSLCIAAAVAPTTALRWINKLIAMGLLERQPDAFDRRRAFVALTPRGSDVVREYFAALHRAGLTAG